MLVTRPYTMLAPAGTGYPKYSVRLAGGMAPTPVNTGVTQVGSSATYYVDLNLNAGSYAISWYPDAASDPDADAFTVADPIPSADVAAIKAKTDNLPASPAAVGSAMAVADKTGFSLAPGSITSATFGAIAAGTVGFLERLRLLTERFLPVAGGSVTAPRSGNGSLVVRGADGTPIATQPVTDDGTTQTLGPPQ